MHQAEWVKSTGPPASSGMLAAAARSSASGCAHSSKGRTSRRSCRRLPAGLLQAAARPGRARDGPASSSLPSPSSSPAMRAPMLEQRPAGGVKAAGLKQSQLMAHAIILFNTCRATCDPWCSSLHHAAAVPATLPALQRTKRGTAVEGSCCLSVVCSRHEVESRHAMHISLSAAAHEETSTTPRNPSD